MDNNLKGAPERALAEELARFLGAGVEKTASAPKGTPAEGVPDRGFTKIASMNLREILDDPNFRQGVWDEITALEGQWKPLVEQFVKNRTGQ